MPERAALITGLILERPLCLDCLAMKTALTSTVIEHTLAIVHTVMAVNRINTRCRACGGTKETVSLRRPTTAQML